VRGITVDCARTVPVAVFSPRAAARALCRERTTDTADGYGRSRRRLVVGGKGTHKAACRREKVWVSPADSARRSEQEEGRDHYGATPRSGHVADGARVRRTGVSRGVIADTRVPSHSATRWKRRASRASSCIHGRRALMGEERGTSRAGLVVWADGLPAPRAPRPSPSPLFRVPRRALCMRALVNLSAPAGRRSPLMASPIGRSQGSRRVRSRPIMTTGTHYIVEADGIHAGQLRRPWQMGYRRTRHVRPDRPTGAGKPAQWGPPAPFSVLP